MEWNPQTLDQHLAPGIATFQKATIPDLAGKFPEDGHWVTNYFLNSVLRGSYPDQTRQLGLGFLRRAQLVIDAYHDARRLTLAYLDGNDPHNPRIRGYYAATSRWEQFAIDASIALDLFKYLNDDQGAFTKGDRSLEDRLYHIANKIKHMGDDICNRRLYGLTDSVPLWLSDTGLNAVGTVVTYEEAARFVTDCARAADEIQDPVTQAEKAKTRAAAAVGLPNLDVEVK